jgi:hypothetical protein
MFLLFRFISKNAKTFSSSLLYLQCPFHHSRIDTPRSIPAPRSENGKRKVLKPTTGPELALRDKSEAEWHSYR